MAEINNGIHDASSGKFQPPPGACEVQLELWRRIFSLRCRQIKTLSPAHLESYVKVIASDLKTSRLKQVGDEEGSGKSRIDLANGYYSSFLVDHFPSQSVVDSIYVARHIMALFYRAVDDRLSPDERVHGLDSVNRAFDFLERFLRKQSLSLSAQHSLQPNNSARLRDTNEVRTANSMPGKMGGRQNDRSSDLSTSYVSNKEVVVQENEGNKRSRDETIMPKSGAMEISVYTKKTKPSKIDDASVFDVNDAAAIRSVDLHEVGEDEQLGKEASCDQMTVMEDETDSPTLFPLTSFPPPIATCSMRHIPFLPDNNSSSLASSSLEPRQACVLVYDSGFHLNGSGASLDDESFMSVRDRLQRWDPYWKVLKELGRHEMYSERNGTKTPVATRTTSCTSSSNIQNLPASCALVNVDLPNEYNGSKSLDAFSRETGEIDNPWGLRWDGSLNKYETGDRRVLLRMLPLTRTEYDKKHHSDCHQWPIGTFIQLSRGLSQQVLLVTQRRQQSHDPTLWKGLCHPLDVTSIVKISSTPFSLKICSRETIEKAEMPKHNIGSLVSKVFEGDDGELRPFVGSVVSHDEKENLYKIVYEDGDAEELSYDEISDVLVEKKKEIHSRFLKGSYAVHLAVCEYIAPDDLYDELMKKIPKTSLEASRVLAEKHFLSQIVSIDSDNEGVDSSSNRSLTLSLLCPLSMSAIKTAVRGRNCRHLQCFDMRTFLHYNKHISGGRWRCGVCEDFISVRDLVHCGLYETILLECKDKISAGRDKVSFRSDGSWCLKEDSKPRRGGDGEKGRTLNDAATQAPPEIIDLV